MSTPDDPAPGRIFSPNPFEPAMLVSRRLTHSTRALNLAGPGCVIDTLVYCDSGAAGQGAVLMLGAKWVIPLLAEVWDELSQQAQLEMTTAESGFVSVAAVDFWLVRLEIGPSEAVFGSAVAAIARMSAIDRFPYVFDIESFLSAGGKAIKLLLRTPFASYLKEIRPRLEPLEAAESEPKVIPQIFEMWPDAQAFRCASGE